MIVLRGGFTDRPWVYPLAESHEAGEALRALLRGDDVHFAAVDRSLAETKIMLLYPLIESHDSVFRHRALEK